MDRRSFLRLSLGLGGLGLTSSLSGCQGITADVPRVVGLKNSVPPQLIKRFRQQMAAQAPDAPAGQLAYSQRNQLTELFEQLQLWQQVEQGKPPIRRPAIVLPWQEPLNPSDDPLPDLITLGDYWLGVAIRQGLVAPLDRQKWPHWQAVDPRWQQLVQRDATGQLSETGQVWGAPYRWGATVIAYRSDLLEQHGIAPPSDWRDLFNPQLKGRFSLLNSAREVIGLALKYLGYSYRDRATGQPTDLSQVPELEVTLQALQRQAKMYSSNAYLQPLILGHTWLAVGWSSDILPQLRTRSNIKVVIPRSGTTLWSDLWVRPKRPKDTDPREYNPWIDAFWEPEFADKLALLSLGGSVLSRRAPAPDAAAQQQNPLLNLADAVWNQCEPLPPLPLARIRQYDSLWRKIRQLPVA
jgi:putative spermidine/putrescine transport system substrate-binding protein